MNQTEFRAFQRAFFQKLRDRPLDLMNNEDDRLLYEPLYDPHHDPVGRLFDNIEFSETESVQLVAGFRGTGKTTEFSRLEKQLWEQGYHVIRVDLDEYVDMHSAVDIRDFLLVLAGAISDKLTGEKLLGKEKGPQKSFLERVRGLVPEISNEITASGGGASVKLAFGSDPGFRGMVRDKLATRLVELTRQVREHHIDVLKALRERAAREVRLVVILDSLEHLRGTLQTAEHVRHSVEELFLMHAAQIGLPSTHMVLSVPAFLFLRPNNLEAQFMNGGVQAWPAYRVQDRARKRTEVVDRVIRLVEKRGEWQRILPDQGALEKLILASGGHLRDLLNMLIEALHRAGQDVAADAAEKVIGTARRAYTPLYKDEIDVLGRIARQQSLKDIEISQHEHVLRFLDAGLVLCYMNDEYWYDVHPLVRDVVLSPA